MRNIHKRTALHSGAAYLILTISLYAGNAFAAIPGSSANIDTSSLRALDITYIDYDTDGNGVTDYRVVGDVDSDGILEWSDIQSALHNLCDPNGDSRQDANDGKLTDLDNDGQADDSYCGTLHILPGEWLSPSFIVYDPFVKDDDQIMLGNYQGLWLRGSGSDQTSFRVQYTRANYCHTHRETGCGGICSRNSTGYLRITGFTFTGLEPRDWPDKNDCDGDGKPYYRDTDYSVRTLQTGVVVSNTPPDVTRDVIVKDVKVTQADYNGFYFTQIDNLTISDLSVLDGGAAGIWLEDIRNAYGGRLHVESVDNAIALGGITISSSISVSGSPQPIKTDNLYLDQVTSNHNHIGIRFMALGAGGISNVTLSNFSVLEPRDATGLTTNSGWGIKVSDYDCKWDEDNDGIVDEPCYVKNLVFNTGSVTGSPLYGFDSNLADDGTNRNYLIRNVNFNGNGYAIGGNDSRNVNLNVPGLRFEENTVSSDDYNQDGLIDLAHLVRLQSNNIVVRNNTISGKVSGGVGAMLLARESDNLTIEGNTLTCMPGSATSCTPLTFWSDVTNSSAVRNSLQMTDPEGIAMRIQGSNNFVDQNDIQGGRIDVYGDNHFIQSNRIKPSQYASVPNAVRLWGPNSHLAHNVCDQLIDEAYCIEVRHSATGTVLTNNWNLKNPDHKYFDWSGTAIIE